MMKPVEKKPLKKGTHKQLFKGMKITVKREAVKRAVTNKWLIASVAIFAIAIALGYYISSSVASTQEVQQVGVLNQECAAYGQQLTTELAANSTACQQNTIVANSSISSVCGAVFYCTYSSSCAYTKPVQTNTLSCLCDALTPTQVVLSGACFKQSLS